MTSTIPQVLLQIEYDDGSLKEIGVSDFPFSIGRAPENDLQLTDSFVSRNHARLLYEAGRIWILDLGSKHGTIIQGSKLTPSEPRAWNEGVPIEIGPYRLQFIRVAPSQPQLTAHALEDQSPEQADDPGDLSLANDRKTIGETELPKYPDLSPETTANETQTRDIYNERIGLPETVSRYLQYLPPIYLEDQAFLGSYLLAFEAIWTPIDQIPDHFDLCLDPHTAPDFFLEQLAGWFNETFDPNWSVEQHRQYLIEAPELYRRRGTRWALQRHLEIYTGVSARIFEPEDQPHLFNVVLHLPAGKTVNETAVRRIIEANRPAHTSYTLKIFQTDDETSTASLAD